MTEDVFYIELPDGLPLMEPITLKVVTINAKDLCWIDCDSLPLGSHIARVKVEGRVELLHEGA